MPTQISQQHQVLILNGHRFSGFADEEPAVELEPVELLMEKWSKDGALHGVGTNRKGGQMTVKLQPTSPSAKWMLGQHAEIQRGERIEWNGTYGDPGLNYDQTLRGGLLKSCPFGTSPDQTFEVVLIFERVTPDYGAADFSPTPEAS